MPEDKIILIDIRDLANPDKYYLQGKTVVTYPDGTMFIVGDPYLYRNTSPLCSLISKTPGIPAYWYYERLNHNWLARALVAGEFESYFYIPYTEEHIQDLDAQSIAYGRYYAYPWIHLEPFDDILIQGLYFKRATDGGDNLKRNYANGLSWMETLAGVAGAAVNDQPASIVPENNILGMAYLPGTDRLDT